MCIYSLYVNEKVTKAKIGETLIRGDYKQHAVLRNEADRLRCIRQGSEMQVEALNFNPKFLDNDYVHQPDGSKLVVNVLKEVWLGKAVTVTLVRWQDSHRYASDAVRLPDGMMLHLSWLAEGTRMVRTRKVRKDAGTKRPRNLAKVLGLDQIRADVPVTELETTKG